MDCPPKHLTLPYDSLFLKISDVDSIRKVVRSQTLHPALAPEAVWGLFVLLGGHVRRAGGGGGGGWSDEWVGRGQWGGGVGIFL